MNKIIIAVLLTLAATTTARAETYLDLEYTVPEGWTQYPGKCRGPCLLNEATKARMDIYTTAGKTPMDGVKSVIGKPNKKGEIAVAGRKGAWGAGNGKVVAATTMGSSIIVFVVEVSQSAADADVAGWAALVDGAYFSGGDSQPAPQQPAPQQPAPQQPAPQPTEDYGAPQPQRTYTVTLVNVGKGCTARMTFDGTAYDIAPGQSRELSTTEGDHDIGFGNNDGSTGSARYNVPKFSTFRGGCATPVAEAPPAETSADDVLAQWAALLDGNTYVVTQTTSGSLGNTFRGIQWRFFRANECPGSLAFSYNGIGTGTGVSINHMLAGCAYLTGQVDGAPAGRMRMRLHALLWDPDGSGARDVNEDVFNGVVHIYTDAFAVLGPFKLIGNGWEQFSKQ